MHKAQNYTEQEVQGHGPQNTASYGYLETSETLSSRTEGSLGLSHD